MSSENSSSSSLIYLFDRNTYILMRDDEIPKRLNMKRKEKLSASGKGYIELSDDELKNVYAGFEGLPPIRPDEKYVI